MIGRTIQSVLFRCLCLLPLSAAAPETAFPGADQAASGQFEVDMQMGVRIPMRDGVELNATLYLPRGIEQPATTIFSLTPYNADRFHERGISFARYGYVFVIVDVRGRGNSGGEFIPFANDARDGHDITEWLAAQSFSDGRISMWGGSYGGMNQWGTASQRPPHLKSIIPVASPHLGVDFPFFKNLFFTYSIQWLTFTTGKRADTNLFADFEYWLEKFSQLHREGRPFAELDQLVGNTMTEFQTWLEHPRRGEYWDAMSLTPSDYAALDIPVLTLTGTYDGDLRGAMHYYRMHEEFGTAENFANHFLVIGPWDHAGTRTPRPEVGGLEFGPDSMVDMDRLHRQWYDWTLGDGDRPELLRDRVAYYVAGPGAEEWRWAPALEEIPVDTVAYALGSDGEAGNLFRAGWMSKETRAGADRTSWRHDPLDNRKLDLLPRVFSGLAGESFDPDVLMRYVRDQRFALAMDGDGVVFHSAPFEMPMEIIGEPRLEITVELDTPDADFDARLYEILSDGSSIALSNDLLRARYRNSLREAKAVPRGEPVRLVFEDFQFISRRIARGSRLRLLITSPNSLFLERNYNAGGETALQSAEDARTATIRLYHSEAHPAVLELPMRDP